MSRGGDLCGLCGFWMQPPANVRSAIALSVAVIPRLCVEPAVAEEQGEAAN